MKIPKVGLKYPCKIDLVMSLVSGFNPSENISQLGLLFPIYGKKQNVPNHQPGLYIPSFFAVLPEKMPQKYRPKKTGTDVQRSRVAPCIWGMSGAPGGGSTDANAKLWQLSNFHGLGELLALCGL